MNQLLLIENGRFLGEEFLLWLWMRGLTGSGSSGKNDDTSACFLDDSVLLVSEQGDVKELSLNKGNPSESQEAFEALSRGMRPCKAKLRILAGDMEWACTLNAAQLDISALKLPTTKSKDILGRIADRIFLLEEGVAHLDKRFAIFLEYRAEHKEELESELKAWIQNGLPENQ